MTKIKNTKKGMAKKTLSMSLVVAMLATSNVPVWAAEFSDGSDVAVTWGTTVKAKFKVTAKDNKAIDSNIKFHYAWKVNGTADSATDIETPTNEQTVTRATVAAEAGKTLTLFVFHRLMLM